MVAFDFSLSLRVRNVKLNSDVVGTRASFSVLLSGKTYFTEISQTETVLEETNVYFRHQCHLQYRFDRSNSVLIKIFGVRDTGIFSGEIGRCAFDIPSLLMNKNKLTFPLPNDVYADVTLNVPGYYSNGIALQFYGEHLHSPNALPLATYFSLILHLDSRDLLLYSSEVIKLDKYPKWKQFAIPAYLIQLFPNSALRVHCFNYNVNSQDTLIGTFETSIAKLQQGVGSMNTYMLVSPNGERINEKSCFQLNYFNVCDTPSIFDALERGMHMPTTIAIDLTASNGNPVNSSSLHYIHPHSTEHPSPYTEAIKVTIPCISKYQANNSIGALGFGAYAPPNHAFSQCFNLSGSSTSCNVEGLAGVLEAYYKARLTVQPFAPTDYADIIYHTTKFAKAESNRKLGLYFLLVIFTNGGLSNPRRTIDAIVDSAPHPMSIVFITLRNERSPDVDLLESSMLKHSDGRLLSRSMVSVVPITDLHRSDGLAIIPIHVSSYFSARL